MVKNYTRYHEYEIENFCSYFKAILVACFNILFVISFISLLVYVLVLQPVLWACTGFDPLYIDVNPSAFGGVIGWGLFISTSTIAYSIQYMRKKISTRLDNKLGSTDSFVISVFRKLKDKTCFKIQFDVNYYE